MVYYSYAYSEMHLQIYTYINFSTSIKDLNKFKHDLLSFNRHISAGLGHLARKRFVHRDLAARNILLSSDSVCKVRTISYLLSLCNVWCH